MAKQGKRRSIWPLLAILVILGGIGAGWRAGLLPLPGVASQSAKNDKPAETAQPANPESNGLIRDHGTVSVPDGSPYRARLVVEPVRAEAVRKVRAYPAFVEADPARTVNVLPPLGGRVSELRVQLGESVAAGQVLVAIESGDLAQVQSDIEKARATVDLTKKAVDRARDLAKIGGGALKDFEQAANDYTQALAEQRRAEIRLGTIAGKGEIAGERRLLISAPIAGTVTALSTAAGSYINDPTQPLMTISNLDSVFVTANVPEDAIASIHPNEEVEFSLAAYPERTFRGRVTSISGLLDPDTRRNKVRVSFENHDMLLKPNMFAMMSIVPPPVDALMIPSSALLMNNDHTTVFVETKPWTFVRRSVELGSDAEGMVAIRNGLSAGDRVVVKGGVLLND
jgi:membrane fusion protein, heavy metal efflux system